VTVLTDQQAYPSWISPSQQSGLMALLTLKLASYLNPSQRQLRGPRGLFQLDSMGLAATVYIRQSAGSESR
jgi:hypothetical protein